MDIFQKSFLKDIQSKLRFSMFLLLFVAAFLVALNGVAVAKLFGVPRS
jgi:hypothetical protein